MLDPERIAVVDQEHHRQCISGPFSRVLGIGSVPDVAALRLDVSGIFVHAVDEVPRTLDSQGAGPVTDETVVAEQSYDLNVITPSASQTSIRFLLVFNPPLRNVQ